MPEIIPYNLSSEQKRYKKSNGDVSLRHLHELFIKYKRYAVCSAPATLKTYCQVFKLLMQFNSRLLLEDLTETTMIQFFEFLNTRKRKVGKKLIVREYKKSSIASIRGALGSFFKWLVAREYIKENPFQKMEYPDISYTDPQAFTAQEFDIICSFVNTRIQWSNLLIKKRNIAIIMLLVYTGLRKEELLGLTLKDVNLIRKTITVRSATTKSKRARIVPINKELVPYLKDYLSQRRNCETASFLISGILDRPLTEFGLRHLCNVLTRETKINCHWHRFRHTFATNFYNLTRDLLTLHVLMGHSSLKMTMTYLRSFKDDHLTKQIKRISIHQFY